ncbi:MAG: single-stranded-DNA-specific exonuclease RecJ [Legionellaceae bacterium]
MHIIRRKILSTSEHLNHLSPVLQRIYAARGITSTTELDHRLQCLLPFTLLTDIDKAARRLEQAVREQQRILVIGDFDADGATSSALAVSALRSMGAKTVEFLVPNRFEFGYGLTPGIVDVAHKWRPHLIITVDNGIASLEGVDAAAAYGIDVLITDHHLPGDVLPKACAIVNPNQAGDMFPSKSIAGVGVIFYVMLALRHQLRSSSYFETTGQAVPNMSHCLDLVALGTVADVVSLDHNNRILVSQGLARIRQGMCRPGILALIEVAGRETGALRERDLGFSVAPRLNAAGRLDDMSLGIDCLLSTDITQAKALAQALDELNVERRKIELEMKEQAIAALDTLALPHQQKAGAADLPVALCLMDESWHQGVIGILAGRLKERYHRPVIAFAKVSDTELKGSARSIPELNIRDVLAAIHRDDPTLIKKFGGHAMAAGLSIAPEHFALFQAAFIREVSQHLEVSACRDEFLTDGPLEEMDLNLNLATLLAEGGPWGQQFPEPLFDNEFEILDQRLVGQFHLKLLLRLKSGGEAVDAIAFYVDLAQWPNHRARYLHAVYKLDINVYRGRKRLQLLISALDTTA